MFVSTKLFIRLKMDGSVENARKSINHSISMLSFLVPTFLSFSEEGTCILYTINWEICVLIFFLH